MDDPRQPSPAASMQQITDWIPSRADPPRGAAESPPIRRTVARRAELAGLAGLFVLAVGLRWPYVQDIPRFTDELPEVLWSLSIARGEILPLVANDPHYGPVWNYLLAGLFVVGPSPDLPRVVALLLGAVLVVVTYLFARDVAGRWPAAIAAGLLLTNAGHIVINSHTARSNSVTPLLTTAALWLVYRAVAERRWDSAGGALVRRRPDPRLLVPAGFLLGLALQTHISVIALGPGLVAYVLWRGRGAPRSAWPYLACLAALIGYGPMLVYNLQTGFWTFRAARDLQQSYAGGRPSDLDFYLTNLGALVQSLSRLLSSTIDRPDGLSRFVYTPFAVVGLALLARRGGELFALAALSMVAVLPYFNPRYGPILSGRYLIPLLPLGFTAIGCVVVAGARMATEAIATRHRTGWRPLALVAGGVFVLFPLLPLATYYRNAVADGRTNQPLFRLTDSILASRRPDEVVLLDEGLGQEDLGAGGTDLKAFKMILGTRGIPYEVANASQARVTRRDGQASMLLLIETRQRATLPGSVRTELLSPEVASASGSQRRYAVYRLTTRARGTAGAAPDGQRG